MLFPTLPFKKYHQRTVKGKCMKLAFPTGEGDRQGPTVVGRVLAGGLKIPLSTY